MKCTHRNVISIPRFLERRNIGSREEISENKNVQVTVFKNLRYTTYVIIYKSDAHGHNFQISDKNKLNVLGIWSGFRNLGRLLTVKFTLI